jgi:hypothetical protein
MSRGRRSHVVNTSYRVMTSLVPIEDLRSTHSVCFCLQQVYSMRLTVYSLDTGLQFIIPSAVESWRLLLRVDVRRALSRVKLAVNCGPIAVLFIGSPTSRPLTAVARPKANCLNFKFQPSPAAVPRVWGAAARRAKKQTFNRQVGCLDF